MASINPRTCPSAGGSKVVKDFTAGAAIHMLEEYEELNPHGSREFSSAQILYVRDTLLPKAIEELDRDRVRLLEEVLAKYGVVVPNRVSGLWEPLGDVPRNEHELREMFASSLKDYGYRVVVSGSDFPDWLLLDEDDNYVYAEVEHRSSNFSIHGHDPAVCDLVVCWEHDDPALPIPVIEVFSDRLIEPRNPYTGPPGDRSVVLRHPKYSTSTSHSVKPQWQEQERASRGRRREMMARIVQAGVDSGLSKTEAVQEVAETLGLKAGTIWSSLARVDNEPAANRKAIRQQNNSKESKDRIYRRYIELTEVQGKRPKDAYAILRNEERLSERRLQQIVCSERQASGEQPRRRGRPRQI